MQRPAICLENPRYNCMKSVEIRRAPDVVGVPACESCNAHIGSKTAHGRRIRPTYALMVDRCSICGFEGSSVIPVLLHFSFASG
jgi:hypothetical protein